jgi:phage gp36-like protein
MDLNALGFGALWAALGVIATGLFTWLTQRNKGQVDESVAVRAQWELLTSSLQSRLAAVEKEFAEYQIKMAADISAMREAHAREREEDRRRYESDIKALKDLNEGLQRQIIQGSRSQASLMGDVARSRRKADKDGGEE